MDLSEYRTASQANVAAYESCRDFLSREYSGECVLIYGGTVRGIFPSKGEASRAGDEPDAYPCAVVRIVLAVSRSRTGSLPRCKFSAHLPLKAA